MYYVVDDIKLLIELQGADIAYAIFWNTGSGGISIFVCQFNI